jgi:kynurenine formamidase
MNLLECWRDMECVDLSVALSPELPVTWPGLPHFRKRVLNWFEDWREPNGEVLRSAGCFYDQWLEIDEHSGTHVDFPSHILPPAELGVMERRFGSGVPLTTFAGPAAVVNATSFLDQAPAGRSPRIPRETLEDWEENNGTLQPGDILLLDTGYVDRYFAPYPEGNRFVSDVVTSGLLPGWPVPADDFFELVAERGVRLIGISSPSIGALDDPLGPHRAGLLRGITFAEMLCGMGGLPARGALYVGFPLKIAGQSGSPVRAIALKPNPSV